MKKNTWSHIITALPIIAISYFICLCIFCLFSNKSYAASSYNNVASLKNGKVKVGQIVKTNGFISSGDLGGATYSIEESPKYVHENLSIPLNNGLYANIIINNRSINAASAGIFPNNDMYPLLQDIEECLKSDVDEFKFNNGTYVFTRSLKLGGFTYTGSSSTTWMVDPSFSERTYRIIRADSREWGDIPFDLNIKKINFLYETHSDCPVNPTATIVLAVAGCNNCNITNCTFTVRPALNNGCFARVTNLWFCDVGTSNVHISNSKFYNLASTEHTASHRIGGCFWFMNKDYETANDITINNCSFTTTNSDEAIAFWGGLFKHIEITNCDFKSSVHQCDVLASILCGKFEVVSINNCQFQSDISTKKHLVFSQVTPNELTDISIQNCTFINNNIDIKSRVAGDGDINAFISVPFNKEAAWTLNLKGNTFKSLRKNYTIKNIVNLFGSDNVNCVFDASNIVEVNTTLDQISRECVVSKYY